MHKAKGGSPGRNSASSPKTAHRPNYKHQGELSELAFVYKAATLDFGVSKPYGDNLRYDFVVDSGPRLWRVQVKSTIYKSEGSYRVTVIRHHCGRTVTYQPSEIDFLAIHIIPEDTWFIVPIRATSGRTILTLLPASVVPPRPRLWDPYREAWHLFREHPRETILGEAKANAKKTGK